MQLEELKQITNTYQAFLTEKKGSIVAFSESGPAGMGLIHALVKTVEQLESRIKALESNVK